MTELTLCGPDGANPLGFLCALGALRSLTLAWPEHDVRLAWQQRRANWQPVLRFTGDFADEKAAQEAVVQALDAKLKEMKDSIVFHWDGTHQIPVGDYRVYAEQAANQFMNTQERIWADFAATWACEGIFSESKKIMVVADTAFRTMSGQGHQHFLKQMRDLIARTEHDHIAEALFGPWRYADEKLNLRWDPADDRRHAMRWKDPAKDTIKTVWGANRLAIEALPLHPAFPQRRKLETTGFQGHRQDNTFWTWPLWDGFLSLAVTRSVLALHELQAEKPSHVTLAKLGIQEVCRAQRIKVEKFRAFTPARPV